MSAWPQLLNAETLVLTTAGNGRYDSTQLARLRKTLFFNQYRDEALAMIAKEVDKFHKASIKGGWTSISETKRYKLISVGKMKGT
jgi:hypothetical protein